MTGEKPRAMIAQLSQFPVDLIHAVIMRGPDQRIHLLCGIYAKKDGTRGSSSTGADGGWRRQQDLFRNAIS